MAAPILPKEAQIEFDCQAREYSIFIYAQQYDSALIIIRKLYDKMLGWQEKYHKRFHKGYPIHNIGYTLYLQNNIPDALKYFILAYIEDLLSAESEDEADSTPAGQALIVGYRLSSELLQLLKQKVHQLKEQDRIPLKPEEVIQAVEESSTDYMNLKGRITVVPKSLRKFAIFESEWDKRVFVGGGIGLEFLIKEIAKIVQSLGYDPIVCSDFETPMGMGVHRKCLMLLHNCKYAIFDVAEQVGQLMELERVSDYEVKNLVIWPQNKDKAITEMLKSHINVQQFNRESYARTADFEDIIHRFLTSGHIGPSGPIYDSSVDN